MMQEKKIKEDELRGIVEYFPFSKTLLDWKC